MVPEGVATLYAFLGLVTPGLVYQLLRERARPALEETSFREASRVALTSGVLTTLAIGTLVLLQPNWLVDWREWLRQGDEYVKANPELVAWSVLAAVVLACIYALLTNIIAGVLSRFGKTPIENSDVWYQLLVDDVPKGTVPWVGIKTDKDVWLWGHVDFFTVGKSLDDREISLKGPGLAVQDTGSADPHVESYWQRISVKASEVRLLKVAYEPRARRVSRGRSGSAKDLDADETVETADEVVVAEPAIAASPPTRTSSNIAEA